MSKTILLTGATDGIGLATAKKLVSLGNTVLIHGRNPEKLQGVKEQLSAMNSGQVHSYQADLSDFSDTVELVNAIGKAHSIIDVIINNAGIYKSQQPITKDNLDVRFVVNTLTPYLITQGLLPRMKKTGRVINVSSAAQSPVDLLAMAGQYHIEDAYTAYAQSKLAITMWSRHVARELGETGPVILAVNPGSLLASKMVHEGFGVEGKDINIGADILVRACMSDEFTKASGLYFDNDAGKIAPPHLDGMDERKCEALVAAMNTIFDALGVNVKPLA